MQILYDFIRDKWVLISVNLSLMASIVCLIFGNYRNAGMFGLLVMCWVSLYAIVYESSPKIMYEGLDNLTLKKEEKKKKK